MNPLFPSDDDTPRDERSEDYVLKPGNKRIEPINTNPAVELIRHKIDAMYEHEPSVKSELAEITHAPKPRSKHQEFMYRLSTSGKSLAEIQTEWHAYYNQLPDDEKHAVWQEFYEANNKRPSEYTAYVEKHQKERATPIQSRSRAITSEPSMFVSDPEPTPEEFIQKRTPSSIKKDILRTVRRRTNAHHKAKQHLKSLLFGLGMGTLVLVIFLFSFFNEVVIAPFIHPGAQAGATPIILSTDGVAPSPTPEVIIPKINAQLPVVYGNQSVDEKGIQKSLEGGVVHYPTTSVPGQKGNAAFFGHSSNNIFNKGQYKFAFVLLHELAPGDIFYLTYDNKVYSYRVYDKRIVNPDDTWVLNPVADKQATVTLITCDPPGTTLHRLVVWGEQISPDPNGNAAVAPSPVPAAAQELPGNGPTLWSRFWNWLF